MPLKFAEGDPLLTTCQTLGIGHNRAGRTENTPLYTRIQQQFPAAFAHYARQCKAGKQASGQLSIWQASHPQLLFLTVRDSSVGATRLRHVQACLMRLARDYPIQGITSLALVMPEETDIRADVRQLLLTHLGKRSLPVVVYEKIIKDQQADETFSA